MTCRTCIYNEDMLCDMYGKLVDDDDEACGQYDDWKKMAEKRNLRYAKEKSPGNSK